MSTTPTYQIIKATSHAHYVWSVVLRYEVFTNEQGYDPKYDIDQSIDQFTYYLALNDEKPVATARYHLINGIAKIETMVVLKAFRKKGIATKILRKIQSDLAQNGHKICVLNAMLDAEPLYLKLGYTRTGKIFTTDAGAKCCEMELKLS